MPNITVDYTDNLDASLDVPALVRALHEAALATAAIPTGGIRVMARRSGFSVVGDGDARNGFVQVEVVIAPGRSPEAKRAIADALFAAVMTQTEPAFEGRPMGVQLALREFDAACTLRRNTMMEPEN